MKKIESSQQLTCIETKNKLIITIYRREQFKDVLTVRDIWHELLEKSLEFQRKIGKSEKLEQQNIETGKKMIELAYFFLTSLKCFPNEMEEILCKKGGKLKR